MKLRADEFISWYYEGVMCCDEDSCGQVTRNVSLRVFGEADGVLFAQIFLDAMVNSVGRTEVDFYK